MSEQAFNPPPGRLPLAVVISHIMAIARYRASRCVLNRGADRSRSRHGVSDGLPGYQFFGGEGATCDTTVTHSRRPKRPQPKGKGVWGDESGRVEGGTRSPKKWYPS